MTPPAPISNAAGTIKDPNINLTKVCAVCSGETNLTKWADAGLLDFYHNNLYTPFADSETEFAITNCFCCSHAAETISDPDLSNEDILECLIFFWDDQKKNDFPIMGRKQQVAYKSAIRETANKFALKYDEAEFAPPEIPLTIDRNERENPGMFTEDLLPLNSREAGFLEEGDIVQLRKSLMERSSEMQKVSGVSMSEAFRLVAVTINKLLKNNNI